ncbi:MAG: RHS repeat-associated core domain-containing protein [Opitutaceae bacterium]
MFVDFKLLHTLTHKVNGTATVATTRTPDGYGRVETIATKLSSASTSFASYDYHYDAHNQRDTVDLADSSRWTYGYDSLGQVQSGNQALSTTQAVPGRAFGYTFDAIGNRRTTTTNGRSASYTPDELNRYNERGVPGALDVAGVAAADARVAVNNVLATRTADRFYAAVPTDNSSAPAYPLVDVVAVHQEGGSDVYARLNTGHLFLPQTPEVFSHDDDGNLSQDGRWNYTWDAENQLVSMQTRTDVATILTALPRQKLDFAYDAYGRRIVKKVSAWNGSAWVLSSYRRFVYEGWNLVAEVDAQASNAAVGTYVWGLDLSGRPQGAGGVGGLLLATVGSGTYASAYDGNGNIVAWTNLIDGTVVGQREYGPFGEALRVSGSAGSVPFGFSSKYTDKETGLAYYGLRYLNVSTGRWLSRDPFSEIASLGLYSFIKNDSLNSSDYLGAYKICESEKEAIDTMASGLRILLLREVDAQYHKYYNTEADFIAFKNGIQTQIMSDLITSKVPSGDLNDQFRKRRASIFGNEIGAVVVKICPDGKGDKWAVEWTKKDATITSVSMYDAYETLYKAFIKKDPCLQGVADMHVHPESGPRSPGDIATKAKMSWSKHYVQQPWGQYDPY